MVNDKNQSDIKFGQVWKAIRDFEIVDYGCHQGCIIPKNARVVVLQTPIRDCIGLSIMPLISKGLDKKLIPNLKEMELKKEGFGIIINKYYFEKWFVLDDSQKIEFDNVDSEIFWKTMKEKGSE